MLASWVIYTKQEQIVSQTEKERFSDLLTAFVNGLGSYIETSDGQWTIKGFIDAYKRVYTISSDTKIVSKILEIHLFPKFIEFAELNGYKKESGGAKSDAHESSSDQITGYKNEARSLDTRSIRMAWTGNVD